MFAGRVSALACLHARVAFVDHIGPTFSADDTAKAIAFLRGFEGIDDFHFSLSS